MSRICQFLTLLILAVAIQPNIGFSQGSSDSKAITNSPSTSARDANATASGATSPSETGGKSDTEFTDAQAKGNLNTQAVSNFAFRNEIEWTRQATALLLLVAIAAAGLRWKIFYQSAQSNWSRWSIGFRRWVFLHLFWSVGIGLCALFGIIWIDNSYGYNATEEFKIVGLAMIPPVFIGLLWFGYRSIQTDELALPSDRQDFIRILGFVARTSLTLLALFVILSVIDFVKWRQTDTVTITLPLLIAFCLLIATWAGNRIGDRVGAFAVSVFVGITIWSLPLLSDTYEILRTMGISDPEVSGGLVAGARLAAVMAAVVVCIKLLPPVTRAGNLINSKTTTAASRSE